MFEQPLNGTVEIDDSPESWVKAVKASRVLPVSPAERQAKAREEKLLAAVRDMERAKQALWNARAEYANAKAAFTALVRDVKSEF